MFFYLTIFNVVSTFAWILWALADVMTFSVAAGTNISQGSYIRFSPVYGWAPGNPKIVPLSILQSSNAWNNNYC